MSYEGRLHLLGWTILAFFVAQAALVVWLTLGQPLHLGVAFQMGAAFASTLANLEWIRWAVFLVVALRLSRRLARAARALPSPLGAST